MTDYPFQIALLIQKSIVGVLTGEERKQLEQWLAEDDEHERMYQELVRPGFLEEARREHHQFQVGEGYRRFVAGKRKTDRLRIGKRWTAVAAMGALVIGVALAFLFHMGDRMEQESQLPVTGVIKPGKAGALLTLSDGRQVVLSDSLETQLKEQTADIRVQGKRLDYSSEHIGSFLVYNTITVPRGGEYQLTLSDGTRVWLNAETELKYPVAFVGEGREVMLKGEAYFEVAKNVSRPFVVKTEQLDIKVLGTSFNVMAYETDESSSVVLVTGAVQVDTKDDEDFRLEPNRMFSYNQGECDIKEVNVNDYILWKDGLYTYRSEHLSVILDRLSRYYGKKISYKSDVADLKCSGKLDMQEDLEVVLDGLSQTAPILYKKIDEEYIVVKEGR